MDNYKSYFDWLALDASFEEFENEIKPLFERDNNEWILSEIEQAIARNIEVLMELLGDNLDNSDLHIMNKKLTLLKNTIEYYNNKSIEDNSLEIAPGDVKLLLARSSLGNVMVEKQIEDIEKLKDERYASLVSLVEKLANGDTNFNSEKQKGLTNNESIRGIYELKDYQVRLIYMRESGYTVVIGAGIKKDDNSLKYRESLANMKRKSEDYRRKIRNGTLNFEEELQYGSKYRQELLNSVGRGK